MPIYLNRLLMKNSDVSGIDPLSLKLISSSLREIDLRGCIYTEQLKQEM